MSLFGRKKKAQNGDPEVRTKDFFDCILPGTMKFFANYYIVGDTYRCVWVIREYPPTTEEQAILAQLADRTGVTLRLYHRRVTPVEEKQIVNNAARKNRLMAGDHDITQAMEAEGNLQDVQTLLATMRNNREILLHCSVYMELKARSMETLEQLQSQIAMELTRAKITVDKLTLRQQEGFLSVLPFGRNQFGDQYERVLPAGSVANMYPLSFSGKTDPKGFYVGRDKYGTNILVDLDRRSNDKTNGSALILGNSGQGKSYLMKLLLTNFRESGKAVICLDVEAEYEDLTRNLGGCYVDYMTGEYIINPLEPKVWSVDAEEPDTDEESPEAFRKVTRLSQHIAFLKDFFRSYKDFTDAQVDTMEILLEKLYAQRGITDSTDFSALSPIHYPVMAEFYWLCQKEYLEYDPGEKHLYTQEMLREICLGIHSMCVGSESRYFNGHTNIVDDKFLCFGVKGLMDTNKRLKDAILFNILSYMSNRLIGIGDSVAGDALYGLGKLYLKQEFPDYDPAKAVEYLEESAAKGNAFAKYQLGKLLCQGELVSKDIARGLPLLKELAENGVTFASYIAGKVYLREEGWQDIKKAILYFRQAAEDGNSYAEYQLGRIYYFGNGVRVDQEKGLEYLKESAARGNEYAANLLLTIQQQHTWGVASCTASLIAQLGRIFQEQDQKQSQRQRPRMDRKHRREIEEKKQAMGIRD